MARKVTFYIDKQTTLYYFNTLDEMTIFFFKKSMKQFDVNF